VHLVALHAWVGRAAVVSRMRSATATRMPDADNVTFHANHDEG
jgi:hypothetical protein